MPPQFPDPEMLNQLPLEQLVNNMQQQRLIEQQQAIDQLRQEVNQLKLSGHLDSQASSKPPSTDLLKKPEKAQQQPKTATESPKRKSRGQPGHQGKTRKGCCARGVDRYYILRPQVCPRCGSQEFSEHLVAVSVQQVATLVERPIVLAVFTM